MRYEFILSHEGKYPVKRMCDALGVWRSGYYYWRKCRPSRREQANLELVEQIKEIYQVSHQTYGSPRVYEALKSMGILCGRNRVARLMRKHHIVGQKPRRRFPVTTQRRLGVLAAPNLLKQDFSADGPNQKWVTDITYIDTAEGWLYLAPVLDLYSRMVVGWSMADHLETSLAKDAITMALAKRSPAPGWIHHSDQGSQYTSEIYQQHLADHHCQVSMSRVGNCYDNATMESFIATLKKECVTYRFDTREEARRAIFEYIEIWYNRRRLHSSLGYLSPLDFERSQDIKCVQ
jgi:transposase InsO family protein